MSNKIINGKEIAATLRQNIKDEVLKLHKQTSKTPCLAVVMVGEDSASKIYVRNKIKACNEVGIQSISKCLSYDTTQQQLLDVLDQLNKDNSITGILVQLPLPPHIDATIIAENINPLKDVDCFNPQNCGRMFLGLDSFVPCTPGGIIELIKSTGVQISGKNTVVLGRSNIVGKPLSILLLAHNATVTVCHSKTQNIKEIAKTADILISAIGKKHFVSADMIKDGAVVIDVGINRCDGKIYGDVDYEQAYEKAAFITPVPGGVGPMTIAMLLKNSLQAAKLAFLGV